MCELFVKGNQTLWSSVTRSLRIDGVATSIRLENFFWNTLEEISHRENMTVNKMITKLYFESLDADLDIGNFTSFLRVCCSRYLSLIADGELIRGDNFPLEQVNSEHILMKEENNLKLRTFIPIKSSSIN
ncbi:ribbon-helix-helix domain-containing protein [Vibrio parahaemolyticus]|uniref:ribbon-helix-helix domain-containing protein n=1 Tax=Vibrio TaxID=662 RepID=UPI001B817038|nr:ribbon-helix-helix domain-containing protein [Vibrio parahaemolyticus]UJW96451.1 ribbon-helix-helix domain-containing protein [Vibrio parahaemolyticus]HBB9944263.1 ribbon-helix-helix domain-containing protein [Vibrio parahaemolyticus]HBC3416734.1 ribbon-helix-helix domain-containing protein [Vibrio parahaemolyticus]HBC3602216.1 ribbon-helix-helix domain-containing protein [Vibrio parahaemolyticus]HBC3878286.1 ribbon-helix-helix domain-containing protein [Vibrio parahaemolyticus]